MAFTYLLSTSVGQVRLAISDTNAESYAFEDAEIEYFLTQGASVKGGIVEALRALLVSAARRAKAFSLPGATYDDRGRVAGLQAALKMYGGDLPTVSVITPASQPYDSGYVERPVVVSS